MSNLVYVEYPESQHIDTTKPSLQVSEDEACGITTDALKDLDTRIVALKCPLKNHYFDTEALDGWFAKKKICPICRNNSENTPKEYYISSKKAKELYSEDFLKRCDNLAEVLAEKEKQAKEIKQKAAENQPNAATPSAAQPEGSAVAVATTATQQTEKVDGEIITNGAAPAEPKKSPASEATTTIYPIRIIPASHQMRPTIAKIARTTPFKVVAMPLNCVHWITYGALKVIDKAIIILFTAAMMAAVTMHIGTSILVAVVTLPISATYTIINTCFGRSCGSSMKRIMVAVQIPSGIAILALGIPTAYIVKLFSKITASLKPNHTPRSIWNNSLVNGNNRNAPAANANADNGFQFNVQVGNRWIPRFDD